MILGLVISILMLFIFQIGVNGSIKLLHLNLITDGYSYGDRIQIFILYGVGQLVSVLVFNNLLKRTGFLRLFIGAAIIISIIVLVHFVSSHILSLQLLSPILSCAQTISFLCLVDLLAPVMNSKLQGSFSIVNQVVRALSLLIPTFSVIIDDIRVLLCIMILLGLLLFLFTDINVLLKDYELTANVSEVYSDYNAFFWSCFFFKVAETIFSTFFIMSLKLTSYDSNQCFIFSLAPFMGRIIFVALISFNNMFVSNISFFIYLVILGLFGTVHYYKWFFTKTNTLFSTLLLYGGFLIINRSFLTKILKSHVTNKKKMFSISQTQYHIEFGAAIIGYLIGSIMLYNGVYGIVLASVCNHIISWFFMLFTIEDN